MPLYAARTVGTLWSWLDGLDPGFGPGLSLCCAKQDVYKRQAPEDMAKLKAAAPKTWNYFASLEANNWGLAEPALEAN